MKTTNELDSLDHVAIPVRDVAEAVRWYSDRFRCRVDHHDPAWALLAFANTRLALVVLEQHPPHVGFISPDAESFGALKTHRDGSRSTYIEDPGGNAVDILAPYGSAAS